MHISEEVKITTVSFSDQRNIGITKTNLLKKNLTYSSNTFRGRLYADFCCSQYISYSIKNDANNEKKPRS